jgi:mono/diheme cytochrome c family protein
MSICRPEKETEKMRMTMVTAALLLAGGLAVAAQDAAPGSIWSGVFSEAQAKRGEEAYQASCAGCHGVDLVSVDSETPSLTGPRFNTSWVGKTIGDRFDVIRKTMPATDPGTLDDQTTIDIVAFILKTNGYPAGQAELGVDAAALGKITIEKPKQGALQHPGRPVAVEARLIPAHDPAR